ncbi:MAG: hypothetical protein CVT49_06875 [candidate division Zixibacteria bacterium HGW-Zixibacteria-1]|nr:MAG: hypothetical protein CVT49_06875 [candidate division Zixibacteria bacterium HGW-Zixibacteria-1]
MALQDEDSTRIRTYEKVKTLIEDQNFFGAVTYVQSLGKPEEVAKVYEKLVLDFYWKAKSIPDVVSIARAGLQYCLTEAERIKQENPEEAAALKESAKKMSYNLASFTWPGWDEKGYVITHQDILVGLDAARLNVRLVHELNNGDEAISIAYWGLGAQLIATQQYDQALDAFDKSRKYAISAGNRLNELLAEGFIGVTMIISGDEKGRDKLGEAVKKLNEVGSEDALFFVGQFNTALNVFIK